MFAGGGRVRLVFGGGLGNGIRRVGRMVGGVVVMAAVEEIVVLLAVVVVVVVLGLFGSGW